MSDFINSRKKPNRNKFPNKNKSLTKRKKAHYRNQNGQPRKE